MLPEFPNVLLVGSNSRKAGKTSIVSQLIGTYGDKHPVSAIKLAIYDNKEDFNSHYPSVSDDGVFFLKEKEPGDGDSGKFLAAGAKKSWFVAILQSEIHQVIDLLYEIKSEGGFAIVESTSLRNYILPGLFIFVHKLSKKDKKKSVRSLSDMEVETGSDDFKHIDRLICIEQDTWVFC
ncbi:MAG: hypothetical protein ACQESJ_01650 [Bacteroidota bacterium]